MVKRGLKWDLEDIKWMWYKHIFYEPVQVFTNTLNWQHNGDALGVLAWYKYWHPFSTEREGQSKVVIYINWTLQNLCDFICNGYDFAHDKIGPWVLGAQT